MTEAGSTQRHLMSEAIDLVIRLQNDPHNPVAAEMARAWRARSPEHERAWQRVLKLHSASGQVLMTQGPDDGERPGLGRRHLLLAALGLGAAGTAWAVLPGLARQARADFATGTGEIRAVTLPDGTLATLGPDSAIALDFRPEARRIALLGGMSFFKVAPDRARPFEVVAGEVRARALGTAFDMTCEAEVVSVGVAHGLVEVTSPLRAPAPAARLKAGEWLAYDPALPAPDRGIREAGQTGAWRDRLVIAERETVATLVARIGRWLPERIVVAAPGLGAQRVSGVFDLADPPRALEAVVLPAGGRVRRLSSLLTVISSI